MPASRRHGLTLLELLVGLGVTALLTALLVTGLRSALWRGKTTDLLAHVRTVGQLFAAWSADHRDALLNCGLPVNDAVQGVYYTRPSGELGYIDYLGQWYAWPRVLEMYGGEFMHWRGVEYGLPAVTDPSLWATSPQPWTIYPARRHWRIVSSAEIAYPSAKALLVRSFGYHEEPVPDRLLDRYLLGFADGGAGEHGRDELAPLVEGFYAGARADSSKPSQHTIGGVHGRDLIAR